MRFDFSHLQYILHQQTRVNYFIRGCLGFWFFTGKLQFLVVLQFV